MTEPIDTALIRSQHTFRTGYGTEMDDVCQFCWPTNLDGEETRHDCEVIGYMDEIDRLRAALADAWDAGHREGWADNANNNGRRMRHGKTPNPYREGT